LRTAAEESSQSRIHHCKVAPPGGQIHSEQQFRHGRGRTSRHGGVPPAWANRDGEGFPVKLDLVPINGSEIVIRTPREDREEGGAA